MPNRFNFNKRTLDSLGVSAGKKAQDYYDQEVKPLHLRITDKGAKTSYVRKKIEGISQRILVGSYPDLSIELARKMALEICSAVAQGHNQNEAKKKARTDLGFGELLDRYLEGHAKERCAAYSEIKAVLRRYLSHWCERKLSSICKADVQARLNQIGNNNGKTAAKSHTDLRESSNKLAHRPWNNESSEPLCWRS